MEKQGNRDQNDIYYIPAIRIKLTLQPSEEEKTLSGYQAPNEVLPSKHAELFDYVMLYTKDLYLLKTGNKVQNRSPRDNPQRERQADNRQYKSYSQPQKKNEESQSSNWKDDRERLWQQQQQEEQQQKEQSEQQRSNQQLQNRGNRRRGEYRESNRGDTNQFRNNNNNNNNNNNDNNDNNDRNDRNEGQQRTNQHHFRRPEDFRRPKDRSTSNDNKKTLKPKFEEQQDRSIKRGGELVRRGGPRKD